MRCAYVGFFWVLSLLFLRLYLFPRGASPPVNRTVIEDFAVQHSTAQLVLVSENIYQRDIRKRVDCRMAVRMLQAWNRFNSLYLWDYFSPSWNCIDRERLGNAGDGGSWVCGLSDLKSKSECVLYSYGLKRNASFEHTLLNSTNCSIIAFDPKRPTSPFNSSRTRFYKMGMGERTGRGSRHALVESFRDSLARNGHNRADVLKLALDGEEWDVLHSLMNSEPPLQSLPFDQLIVELHLDDNHTNSFGTRLVFNLFEDLEQRGYRAFARELRLALPARQQLPIVMEYSFIHVAAYQRALDSLFTPVHPAPPTKPQPTVTLAVSHTRARQKGCIYTLAFRHRIAFLTRLLAQLQDHYTSFFPYPVIIFEVDFTEADKQTILSASQTSERAVRFVRVNIDIPKDVVSKDLPRTTTCDPFERDYTARRSSYFYLHHAPQQLSRMGFFWHMRVNDVLEIREDIGYDLFELMEANKILYGFVAMQHDIPACVRGLYSLALSYNGKRGARPSVLEHLPLGLFFTQDLEVSHSSIWTSEEYSAWLEAVHTARGVWTSRWSEGPIRTLFVAMHLDPMLLHWFSDIPARVDVFLDQQAGSLAEPGRHARELIQEASQRSIMLLWDDTSIPRADVQQQFHSDLASQALGEARYSELVSPWQDFEGIVAQCAASPLPPPDVQKCSLASRLSQEALAGPSSEFSERLLNLSIPSPQPQTRFLKLAGRHLITSSVAANDIQPLLDIRVPGVVGMDVSTSILLPSAVTTTQGHSKQRLLWLFGDTFFGSYDSSKCGPDNSYTWIIARNSIAITSTSSPSFPQTRTQQLVQDTCFYWGTTSEFEADAVFQPRSGYSGWSDWWWLFSGVVIDSDLFLFGYSLNKHFTVNSSIVVHVPNSDLDVLQWKYRAARVGLADMAHELQWNSAVFQDPATPEYVFLLGRLEVNDMNKNQSYFAVLGRVATSDLKRLAFDRMQVLVDNGEWVDVLDWHDSRKPAALNTDAKRAPDAMRIFEHTGLGGGETSVVFLPTLQRWCGFFANHSTGDICMICTAHERVDQIWDPECVVIYRTPIASVIQHAQSQRMSNDIGGLVCYAVKLHEAFSDLSKGELVLTYVCSELWRMRAEADLYVPQFVRVKLTEFNDATTS